MAKELKGIKNPVLKADTCEMTLDFGNTYKDGSLHKGIDLITGAASKVIAPCDGTIERAYDGNKAGDKTANFGMGNAVYLKTDNGLRIRFHHLACGSVKVKIGAKVKKGDQLGIIGNTGNSTGRHLHVDISELGKKSGGRYVADQDRTYYDPKPYLMGEKALTKATTPAGDKTTPSKAESAAKAAKMTVNTAALNVRADASLSARIVKVIYKGDQVTVTETKGDFAKIGAGMYCAIKYLKEAK